ncbi:hypothetical protein BDK61_2484 [Haloarcula quadrata]|uniref:Uncharacterized protein n=8 Tax=Haloarcula TaxID=2237 RepID=A0A495R775_9EURY|nr:hypothetical protein BDK61_2484 [Haloarcula quadrata]
MVRRKFISFSRIYTIIMDCTNCGTRMSYNDQTTKLTEFVCPSCHETVIDWKAEARNARVH